MTLRSFRHYLAESARTYNYKIKIAGDCKDGVIDLLIYNLKKFDPVKISEPKRTPVQANPHGFPGLKDQSVCIIDCEFRYPATEPMIKQIARLAHYDENLVRVIQADHDGFDEVSNRGNSPVLSEYELEDDGKEASNDYADSYRTKIKKQHDEHKIDYGVNGKTTEFKHKETDLEKLSPMSRVKLPPRPATASSKQR